MCIPVCATKKCLQMHHHVSPPTFGVDILLLLLYSNIYKGLRSFVNCIGSMDATAMSYWRHDTLIKCFATSEQPLCIHIMPIPKYVHGFLSSLYSITNSALQWSINNWNNWNIDKNDRKSAIFVYNRSKRVKHRTVSGATKHPVK